jgi:hypothetical protein
MLREFPLHVEALQAEPEVHSLRLSCAKSTGHAKEGAPTQNGRTDVRRALRGAGGPVEQSAFSAGMISKGVLPSSAHPGFRPIDHTEADVLKDVAR